MITLKQHLDPTTPKRILALDGGGIRGALTLGYLKNIEDTLRKQHNNDPAFRLSDYFDLIGGTTKVKVHLFDIIHFHSCSQTGGNDRTCAGATYEVKIITKPESRIVVMLFS